MLIGDDVVGVLSVWRTEVEPFDARIALVLGTFANQAALAVRNVQQTTALSRKVDQLEALSAVGKVVGSSLDVEQVLSTIVSHAVELSETDGGSLMEYDQTTRLFRVRAAYGTSEATLDRLRRARIHADETWVGRCASATSSFQIEDLDDGGPGRAPGDPARRRVALAGRRAAAQRRPGGRGVRGAAPAAGRLRRRGVRPAVGVRQPVRRRPDQCPALPGAEPARVSS